MSEPTGVQPGSNQTGRVIALAGVVVSAVVLLAAVASSGQQQSAPASPPATSVSQVAAVRTTVAPPAPKPTSAQEYYAVAKRSGKKYTPKRGSKTRTQLMNAARKALGTKSKFVVHSLRAQGEVAWGSIEPYPAGSGTHHDVTWVRWKKRWWVIDPSEGLAAAVQSTQPAYSSSVAPYNYGDANGDGDSGVLWPSVPVGANPSPAWTGKNTEWHWVNGYTRSDGTPVKGHYRRTE